jgi:hypothetical protein
MIVGNQLTSFRNGSIGGIGGAQQWRPPMFAARDAGEPFPIASVADALILGFAAAFGTAVLDGRDASLRREAKFVAAQGTAVLDGRDATLSLQLRFTAAFGTGVLDGRDAFLNLDAGATVFNFNALHGTAVIDGRDASLLLSFAQILTPDRAAYALNDGMSSQHRETRGGLGRLRRDMLNPTVTVDVSWIVGPDEYAQLAAFQKANVGKTFSCDLVSDSYEATLHNNCKFVPGTFTLSAVQGETYTVTAQIEAALNAPNEAFDLSFVDVYGAYQEGSSALLEALALLTNDEFQDHLGA